MMSGIRAKDTRPEMFIRLRLHALGFRYRIHVKDIPGKPDIVLPKHRALIVVHGCFWHGHHCRYFKLPQTRQEFWQQKIASNMARDSRDLAQQLAMGWRVLTVWECAVRANMRATPMLDCAALAARWIIDGPAHCVMDESGITEA